MEWFYLDKYENKANVLKNGASDVIWKIFDNVFICMNYVESKSLQVGINRFRNTYKEFPVIFCINEKILTLKPRTLGYTVVSTFGNPDWIRVIEIAELEKRGYYDSFNETWR